MDVASVGGRRAVVVLAVLAAIGLVGGYGVAMRARPEPATIELATPSPDAGAGVFVHVGGAVHHPGLYELPPGSRVNDAVTAAGGPVEGADLDALNLAAQVEDGEKVLVPEPGAAPAPGAPAGPGAAAGALINVNTADTTQLEELPGIGPAIAARIIAYRTEHGGFRTVDELEEVPGIGPKIFAGLRDLVTV